MERVIYIIMASTLQISSKSHQNGLDGVKYAILELVCTTSKIKSKTIKIKSMFTAQKSRFSIELVTKKCVKFAFQEL